MYHFASVYTNKSGNRKRKYILFWVAGTIYETPKHIIVILMVDLNANLGGSRKDIEEVVEPTTEKTCNITAG